MNRIILILTVLAALVPTAMSNVSAPVAAYSQVAELNNISTSTQTQTQTPVSTQCLDFNQDGICESIVLVNGTIINNPDVPVIAPTINGNNITNSTAATATVGVQVDENDPCGGGVEYKLDGEIFCTPEEYEDARKIQYEQEQEEKGYPRPLLTEYMPKPSSSNDNDNDDDNDDKGDEEDDNDDEDIVYCEGQRVPEGADSCYDQYDFEEGDGTGCDDNDDYCNEEDECGRSDVDCIDDRGFDEDDYDG